MVSKIILNSFTTVLPLLGEMIRFDLRTFFLNGLVTNHQLAHQTSEFHRFQANSHSQCGWQRFTDHVISTLNDQREGTGTFRCKKFRRKKENLR